MFFYFAEENILCIPILILDPKLLLENGPKGHFIMITALWPCSLYSLYKLPKDGLRKFGSQFLVIEILLEVITYIFVE